MHVKKLVPKVKGLAVKAGGFIRRRKRLTIAVVVAALLFGPLVTTDGELVFLNAVGLGTRRAAAQAVPRAAHGSEVPPLTASGRSQPIPTRKGRLHPGTALLLCPQAGAIQRQHNAKEVVMTTATLAAGNRTMATVGQGPGASLEELVDRLMAALFKELSLRRRRRRRH